MTRGLFDQKGNRKYLTARKRLAFVYAASKEGLPISAFCLTMAFSCARKGGSDQLHERLKPGTALAREFGGTRHIVTIVAGGYVWRDQTYPSLSVIAKQITGTNWNGPRFFGLRQAGRHAKARGFAGPAPGSLPVAAK